MFNKNDPLISSVQQVMKENAIRRSVEQKLNEELGIASKKALPHEHHKNYDALLEERIAEALSEGKVDSDTYKAQNIYDKAHSEAKKKGHSDSEAHSHALSVMRKSHPDHSATSGEGQVYKKMNEALGGIPKTPREKDLAAKHGNPNRITKGDVLKARGVLEDAEDTKKSVVKAASVTNANKDMNVSEENLDEAKIPDSDKQEMIRRYGPGRVTIDTKNGMISHKDKYGESNSHKYDPSKKQSIGRHVGTITVVDEENLDEVSKGLAIRAAADANDPIYSHPKGDALMAHVKRKFGAKAAKHAQDKADVGYWGRDTYDTGDSLQGGLRNYLEKKLTKSGKIPKNTQTAMKGKTASRKITGPKGKLPEEANKALGGNVITRKDPAAPSALEEKAVSKAQHRFFGLVRAIQKGKAQGSAKAEKAAAEMSTKEVRKFAKTKEKGLPEKVSEATDIDSIMEEIAFNLNEKAKEMLKAPFHEAAEWFNSLNEEQVSMLEADLSSIWSGIKSAASNIGSAFTKPQPSTPAGTSMTSALTGNQNNPAARTSAAKEVNATTSTIPASTPQYGGGQMGNTPSAVKSQTQPTMPKPATPAASSAPRTSERVASQQAGVPDSRNLRAPVKAAAGEGETGKALAAAGVSKADRMNPNFLKSQGITDKPGSAAANLALNAKMQAQRSAVSSAENPKSAANAPSPAAKPAAPTRPGQSVSGIRPGASLGGGVR